MYQKYIKRLFDIILSSVLILFLFPLMILIFFLVWIFIDFQYFFKKDQALMIKFLSYISLNPYMMPIKIFQKKNVKTGLVIFYEKQALMNYLNYLMF